MNGVLAVFPEMTALGRKIAEVAGLDLAPIELHRFPDGECLVTLPETQLSDRDVAILATLRNPDALALALRFAAETAREFGARSVGLAAPYLAYMRQDRRFAPGQAISAPVFARYLEESFDWLVTVDPHLHRIAKLDDLFAIPCRRVVTAPVIAGWIQDNIPDAVLVGPDSESEQWVAEVAGLARRPYEVLTKHRFGDRDVEVSIPQSAALAGGTPVIIDDIASSGRTMIQAVSRLLKAGSRPPVCVVIHAVFAGDAEADIIAAGAARLVTTDSIPHASNDVELAVPLADAITSLLHPAERPDDRPRAGT
ncbi:ribose-phosphate diphosphokinase [Allopontixanthobacter sp.]|uniref:ribose-phosphate diphosphokinase n=1 Tax=Allopontixanthobacter sp. TaxID=2906452 RepID=UPI002ABA8857|nr:ribose-phosphate diphosphokinase [Allopontixanthobacter sp.]MDZ4308134.1 ribose-phosphate diphosphokinase [Allopontixanthobacter sp.]